MDIKNVMDCQEMFFHWAMNNGFMLERIQDNKNSYALDSTHYAFQGFRAGYELQQAEITMLSATVKSQAETIELMRLALEDLCEGRGLLTPIEQLLSTTPNTKGKQNE